MRWRERSFVRPSYQPSGPVYGIGQSDLCILNLNRPLRVVGPHPKKV
jgi:hypothetical protein